MSRLPREKRKGKKRAAAAAKSLPSCLTLCDPIDGSPPGSPIPGILQVRTLEWVAISFSNAWKWKVKVKSCLTLSDPMDCSPPGSSVHGIFQARVLEWGAIAFSEKQAEVLLNHILTNSHLEQDLQDLLEQTSKKDVLFIIGDWNAKVGSQEIPGTTGKFALEYKMKQGKG